MPRVELYSKLFKMSTPKATNYIFLQFILLILVRIGKYKSKETKT